MTAFIIRRLIATSFILVFLSIAVFTMLRVMPGDDVVCPGFCSPEQIAAAREAQGLDKPYFPVSADTSRDQDWWLLVLPAAGAALAYGAWRLRRHDASS